MTPTHKVSLTGQSIIDGLLYGVAWTGPITYAFPTLSTDYDYGPENTDGFAPLNAQQQAAATFAFSSVEKFTLLDIAVGEPYEATIRIAQSEMPTTAYAYMPGNYNRAGDIWLGLDYDYTTPKAGNYAWSTVLHEIGHALGLKHGHEAAREYPALPADVDGLEYTVMSYHSYAGSPYTHTYLNRDFPHTFMQLDILVLQHMYGADYETKSGDTVYRWKPSTEVEFKTLWDGGGCDTYDLSAFRTSVTIDLRPGQGSIFGERANLSDGVKGASVYNALLYNDDQRSLIENAIGGNGKDVLIGNATDNTLTGGKGADKFLIGLGGGHDVITDFNPERDKLVFNGQRIDVDHVGRLDFGPDQSVDIWF